MGLFHKNEAMIRNVAGTSGLGTLLSLLTFKSKTSPSPMHLRCFLPPCWWNLPTPSFWSPAPGPRSSWNFEIPGLPIAKLCQAARICHDLHPNININPSQSEVLIFCMIPGNNCRCHNMNCWCLFESQHNAQSTMAVGLLRPYNWNISHTVWSHTSINQFLNHNLYVWCSLYISVSSIFCVQISS